MSDNVDLWDCPVLVENNLLLSKSSGRIDILSPVLNLRGIEDDLVLDLHYSKIRARIWNAVTMSETSAGILKKLVKNQGEVKKELFARVPDKAVKEVIDDWMEDLAALSSYVASSELVRFERVQ